MVNLRKTGPDGRPVPRNVPVHEWTLDNRRRMDHPPEYTVAVNVALRECYMTTLADVFDQSRRWFWQRRTY